MNVDGYKAKSLSQPISAANFVCNFRCPLSSHGLVADIERPSVPRFPRLTPSVHRTAPQELHQFHHLILTVQLHLDHQPRVHPDREAPLDPRPHANHLTRQQLIDFSWPVVFRPAFHLKLVAVEKLVVSQVALYSRGVGVAWELVAAFVKGPVVVGAGLV